MRVCKNCRNGIPDGMKICPHCGKLPPKLFPNFYLYLALTLVAAVSAFYFRPFAEPPAASQVSIGMLWVSFVIFVIFAVIFAAVSLVVFRTCRAVPENERLDRAEVVRYKNMRNHISAGRHYYAQDEFCTVCGRRRKKK